MAQWSKLQHQHQHSAGDTTLDSECIGKSRGDALRTYVDEKDAGTVIPKRNYG